MPSTSGVIPWVTWLRIAAVYAVVLIHTAGPTAAGPGSTTTADGWVARALDLPFLWAVPVFVMLSGALSLDPKRFRGSAHYLRKRSVRLVPAVVFWNLVYLVSLIVTVEDWGEGWRDALGLVLAGEVAPHLYFFWIVLGLSVLTPVLVPWLAGISRAGCLIAALAAWAVPVLSTWPLLPGGEPLGVHTAAWSWWIPYLGAYLMGWALRGVILPRWATAPAAAGAVALMGLLAWQWKNPAAPQWLHLWFPANYYSLTVAALSCLVLLLAQRLVRPGGIGGVLTRPAVLRAAEPVSAATLGIFALHVLVLGIGTSTGVLGAPETAWPILLVRFLAVATVTTAVVLLLRRVPIVRTVL
ncbi:MAG TPA: acyltransferase [Candidatus Ruania gallistercoris]|uniref:Acyltransferase n=1 Tax=Candidatus Ruania gallistercoris TaxID=2838746 RepID=A0A9D2EEZ4_9MICO|nr:acyltransferase [Candidatus Ruania gallistercoris]